MGMILNVCHAWIAGLWIVFLIYWLLAAPFTKRTVDRGLSGAGLPMRVLVPVSVVAAVVLAHRLVGVRAMEAAELYNVPMAVTGAFISTLGAGFAFAARAAIGRNWGTPGSLKADGELVTNGPYRFVRHPIYSGVLLMMIGTAIGLIPTWWLVVAAAAAFFIYSARREEELMAERFPAAYPAYRARTKMLLPFIF